MCGPMDLFLVFFCPTGLLTHPWAIVMTTVALQEVLEFRRAITLFLLEYSIYDFLPFHINFRIKSLKFYNKKLLKFWKKIALNL